MMASGLSLQGFFVLFCLFFVFVFFFVFFLFFHSKGGNAPFGTRTPLGLESIDQPQLAKASSFNYDKNNNNNNNNNKDEGDCL